MSAWNILTRTHGGTVSLIKNLTYEEARGIMQRLRRPFDEGDPWSERAIKNAVKLALEKDGVRQKNLPEDGVSGPWLSHSMFNYSPSPGDLEQIECWGPPGEEMIVWPKPHDFEERYQRALNAARLAVLESGG